MQAGCGRSPRAFPVVYVCGRQGTVSMVAAVAIKDRKWRRSAHWRIGSGIIPPLLRECDAFARPRFASSLVLSVEVKRGEPETVSDISPSRPLPSADRLRILLNLFATRHAGIRRCYVCRRASCNVQRGKQGRIPQLNG
jgi:hypothetical protein